MATNRTRHDARFVELNVGATVNSNDPVVVGDIAGVAQYDNIDGKAVVDTEGAYKLSVEANDTTGASSAVSEGQSIYLDDGSGSLAANTLTPDDTNGKFFGYALESISGGTTKEIEVRLGT